MIDSKDIDQLDQEVRDAVLGNVGTLIIFRLGPKDAAIMAREFEPHLHRIDLSNLPNRDCDIKLMIAGTPSRPFSATTLPPSEVEKMNAHVIPTCIDQNPWAHCRVPIELMLQG